MSYSIEDLKRLVPEANEHEEMCGFVRFLVRDGGYLFSDSGPGKALLDTRRQLEIAREGLEKMTTGVACGDIDELARETLAAIEGVTK
jgi:hypothetical protein